MDNPDATAMRAEAAARIIVALDTASVAAARTLVNQLPAEITAFKIGLELIYAGGVELARELAASGRNVFLDAKLLDIGNTVERATAQIAALGARYLTVHATDTKTLTAAVRGRGQTGLRLLGVTVMTNLDFRDRWRHRLPAGSCRAARCLWPAVGDHHARNPPRRHRSRRSEPHGDTISGHSGRRPQTGHRPPDHGRGRSRRRRRNHHRRDRRGAARSISLRPPHLDAHAAR